MKEPICKEDISRNSTHLPCQLLFAKTTLTLVLTLLKNTVNSTNKTRHINFIPTSIL